MRIFTLAWEFPPIMSGESVVCLRMLKASAHQYDVCCGGDSEPQQITDNISSYPMKGKYVTWPLRAAILFIKLNKIQKYDAIYSRAMPPNGHLAGLIIKIVNPKIKWIVYFSDPVWNSPFINLRSLFIRDGSHRPNYILMKIFGVPAKLAIHMSNLLVFNNERLARYVTGSRYDTLKHKIVIVPYGHEGVITTEKARHDKYIIAHVGQIYGNRTFSVLITALSLLKQNYCDLYNKLEMQQVGFLCEEEKRRVFESEVLDCFHFTDAVGYDESLRRMRQADCLLIIDPVFLETKYNIYTPAKIFDYMSTGLPIVAIADDDSATADIMAQIEGIRVPHNGAAVYKMLKRLINDGAESPDITQYETFRVNQMVRCLDARLENK